MTEDLIILLNDGGQSIGTAERLPSHHLHTPLHLAFSCYIFNDKGEFLVTQRAHSKKVWPSVWTNSICGHPAPDEEMTQAIKRRLDEELGMTAIDFKVVLPNYRYKTPPYNGIIENEICPVYVARTLDEPKLNPEEVADFKWEPWLKFIEATQTDRENLYSWWCKDQIKQLKDNKTVLSFTRK